MALGGIGGGCGGANPETAHAPSAVDPLAEERKAGEGFSVPEEYRARAISAEAGRFYFEEAGVGDPYGAGIPYPLFLALQKRYPQHLGKDWLAFNDKFGTFANPKTPADPNALPVGFHLTTDPNTQIPFLMMNCQVCHTDVVRTSAGARLIKGMGNQRLRLHAYDAALTRIAKDESFSADALLPVANRQARRHKISWGVNSRAAVVRQTVRKMQSRAQVRAEVVERLADGLPGRVAPVEGFIAALRLQHGARIPMPKSVGWVKIPDVAPWRYRTTNSFDGATVGSPVAMVAEADFGFGVRPAWYQRQRHIPTSIYLFLKQLSRKPSFPGGIDRDLAELGAKQFAQSCAGCHGSYGGPMKREVAYQEKVVPLSALKTDPVRLEVLSDELLGVVNSLDHSRGLLSSRKTGGYVPRPLVDVWARGLYGHAGQWPDLETLATPPAQRPTHYLVDTNALYELQRVGVAWQPVIEQGGQLKLKTADGVAPLKLGPGRYVYDARKPGFDVGGHTFLSDLPKPSRRAVLEYLKTL